MAKKNIKKEEINLDNLERILYANIEGQFLHIKVGNSNDTNMWEQIKDIEDKMVKLLEDNQVNCLVLVTDYSAEVNLIEKK